MQYARFLVVLALWVCFGIVSSVPSVAQAGDCTKEAVHVVGSDEDGPLNSNPINCYLPGQPDPVGTKVCPEYIWATPDHFTNCDEETVTSDCRCCKFKTYQKVKWTVKCVATEDDEGNVTMVCVKDSQTLDTEDFTAGENAECRKEETECILDTCP